MASSQEYKSVSVHKDDYAVYEEMRVDFAKRNNIPEKKVSIPMILNVGMTFYKQRTKLGMK
jgi:hypothetical protein